MCGKSTPFDGIQFNWESFTPDEIVNCCIMQIVCCIPILQGKRINRISYYGL